MRWLLFLLAASATVAAPSKPLILAFVRASGAPLRIDLETRPGLPFDRRALKRDVRALWQTKLYSDIQVSFDAERRSIEFQLQSAPRYRLRSVLFEPSNEKRALALEPGDAIDEDTVRRVADELRRDLRARGFHQARVQAALIAVTPRHADVRLRVDPGRKLRVARVEIEPALRKHVKAIRPTVLLPGLHLSKAYTHERVAESVASLRAALLREGRFDAWIAPVRESVRHGRMEVRFDIDRGPQFHVGEAVLTRLDGSQLNLTDPDGGLPVEAICDSLLHQRAEAERQGRLDFAATLEVRPLPPLPNSPRRTAVTGTVIASEPLSIRQIHFRSDARLRDSALRNALRIEEAAPLDSARLRRSLASLNRFMLLKPVSQGDIEIKRVAPGQVDVTFHLHKQNARRWTIGGPLGPMSLFGPLHGRLETRLPPWGRGLLDLSTYTVGGWLTGAPALVLKNDAWVWKTIWRPSLVLSRPALPGSGLTSGYLWSPQLSPSQLLAANGALRARSQLARWVEGDPPAPPLHVSVTHVERGPLGSIVCREGRDWTDRLRTAGKLALSIAGL